MARCVGVDVRLGGVKPAGRGMPDQRGSRRGSTWDGIAGAEKRLSMRCRSWVAGAGRRGDCAGDPAASAGGPATLDRLEAGESSGGRVKVVIMIFFSRYWCGPRFGVDMPLE